MTIIREANYDSRNLDCQASENRSIANTNSVTVGMRRWDFRMNKIIFAILPLILFISSCNFSTQSRYKYSEVGKIQVVNYGTVIGVRDIDIVSETSSSGGVLGAVGGGVGGLHIGSGSGQLVAGVAGVVAGAVAGSALEQAIRNRGGVEYTVVLQNGKSLTVAQNVSEKDTILKVNDRVIVQINGQYQRVLPANNLPTEIEKPKGITFK